MPYLSPNSFNKRTDADDNRQDKPGASNSPSTLYGDSYLAYKYSSNHLILIAVKAFNESPSKITKKLLFLKRQIVVKSGNVYLNGYVWLTWAVCAVVWYNPPECLSGSVYSYCQVEERRFAKTSSTNWQCVRIPSSAKNHSQRGTETGSIINTRYCQGMVHSLPWSFYDDFTCLYCNYVLQYYHKWFWIVAWIDIVLQQS